MFVVVVFDKEGNKINSHPLKTKPSKEQIQELLTTFNGEYATVEYQYVKEGEY